MGGAGGRVVESGVRTEGFRAAFASIFFMALIWERRSSATLRILSWMQKGEGQFW